MITSFAWKSQFLILPADIICPVSFHREKMAFVASTTLTQVAEEKRIIFFFLCFLSIFIMRYFLPSIILGRKEKKERI